MEFLISLVMCVVYAYAAHELVKWGNKRFKELDMSPNWSAIIAFIFGLYGIIVLAAYGVIKVMIKRMIKG
jgi:hypothetical protein